MDYFVRLLKVPLYLVTLCEVPSKISKIHVPTEVTVHTDTIHSIIGDYNQFITLT